MDREWRETFLMHAETEEFKAKVAEAREIIRSAIQKHGGEHVYVAFSGGKDSTCVVHLALQHAPDIMVLHWDYGPYLVPREYYRDIIENARRLGVKNLRVETSDRYLKEKRDAKNIFGDEMLQKLAPELYKEGYRACFVGLRADESVRRKLRTKAGRSLTQIQEYFPVRNWKWIDVWAYIVSNNLPYLKRHYDKYAKVVGWNRVRFATLFDKDLEHIGASQVDAVLSWRFKHVKY